MSDRRIIMLENNLNSARTLSVLQSKVARQRDDITRLRDRIDTLMFDKKEITQKINKLREGN